MLLLTAGGVRPRVVTLLHECEEVPVEVGLREANQRFSAIMRAVKAGQEIVLTERGRPVALLQRIAASEDGEAGVRRLEAMGLLRRASKRTPMPPWRPRRIRGAPLSASLREEREGS
jgi:prevent-host-death family protein